HRSEMSFICSAVACQLVATPQAMTRRKSTMKPATAAIQPATAHTPPNAPARTRHTRGADDRGGPVKVTAMSTPPCVAPDNHRVNTVRKDLEISVARWSIVGGVQFTDCL